jgi:hypothetical protein
MVEEGMPALAGLAPALRAMQALAAPAADPDRIARMGEAAQVGKRRQRRRLAGRARGQGAAALGRAPRGRRPPGRGRRGRCGRVGRAGPAGCAEALRARTAAQDRAQRRGARCRLRGSGPHGRRRGRSAPGRCDRHGPSRLGGAWHRAARRAHGAAGRRARGGGARGSARPTSRRASR